MTERIPYWAFIDAAARAFSVSTDQVLGSRRFRHIVLARAVAGHLLRKHRLDLSLTEIGRRLGGKDHTSVLHGCKNVERWAPSDEWFAERYAVAERDALSWTRSTRRAPGWEQSKGLTGRDLKSLSAAKFGASAPNVKTDHFWNEDGEPEDMRAMRRDAADRQRAFVAGQRADRAA